MGILRNIHSDYDGFQQIINLYRKYETTMFEDIMIELQVFFAANMSSPLGAILDNILILNNLKFKMDNSTQKILQKNNFLFQYGYDEIPDKYNTTIPFRKFKRTEATQFALHVKQLLEKPNMPNLSSKLKAAIHGVICEIFANSSMHTSTNYIYACGQFFPNHQQIDFTITDMGGGLKNHINNSLNEKFSSTEAISWALIDGNTTKIGIPGGYGLTLLKDLIIKNNGLLQIISDDGFYQLNANQKKTKTFSGYFPGTIVNLQFNTDDTSSYYLTNERKT